MAKKTEQKKLWRAEPNGLFFTVEIRMFGPVGIRQMIASVEEEHDLCHSYDRGAYEYGNYFQTREEAQEVADKINEIFKQSKESRLK